jgi:hypothetical protein
MFKFNGIDILDPTTHRWLPRNALGITGAGQPIYGGVREYELKWNLGSIGDYYQLLSAFTVLSGTNTIVVTLPKFTATGTYDFYDYSGCILREPEYGSWFNEYYQGASLLITNIRV